MLAGAPGTPADHDGTTEACTAALAACSLDKWRFRTLLWGGWLHDSQRFHNNEN